MRAKCGRVPTAVSKKVPFNLISILSGHNAGSFTATTFIVKSAVPCGVSIGNPAAASTRLPVSIVAWASIISTCASTTCCGVGRSRSIVVNNSNPNT